jgi:hypothetical protein
MQEGVQCHSYREAGWLHAEAVYEARELRVHEWPGALQWREALGLVTAACRAEVARDR